MKTEIIRKLDKNYFLLRTHDGLGHFLEAQVKRLLGSEKMGYHGFSPKPPSLKMEEGEAFPISSLSLKPKQLDPLNQ